MASDIYEYTDAQGRTHRVDDLSKVPKDRLKHMLVIGGEDEAAAPATTAATAAPPKAAKADGPLGLPMDVWGVSAFLMLVGIFNKRFMLRVFCVAVSIIWVLYNGYDVFMSSSLSKTAEKETKKKAPVVQTEE